MELTERIAQLLEEKYATDESFADCFTVDIELETRAQTERICGQRLRNELRQVPENQPPPGKSPGYATAGWAINTCWKSAAPASAGPCVSAAIPEQYRAQRGRHAGR
jgi:hypothetical protein